MARSIDAHCAFHGTACKSDRSIPLPGSTAGQKGRPLGRHLLWLSLGRPVSSQTPAEHKALLRTVGDVEHHSERARLRRAFELVASGTDDGRDLLRLGRIPGFLDFAGEPQVSA